MELLLHPEQPAALRPLLEHLFCSFIVLGRVPPHERRRRRRAGHGVYRGPRRYRCPALLVGVGAGVFVSRRRPAPEAPAVIQMATHVVVDDGRMAKADPESPAPPIVAAAEEVPPPVWT